MTNPTQIQRRTLVFETLDQAVADAQHLSEVGYHCLGNWDLSQCCHHLAVLMEYPIDGFPRYRFPLNIGNWVLCRTLAPRMLEKILSTGRWPDRLPTDKRTIPPVSGDDERQRRGDDARGVEQLRSAVARLNNHIGPLHASPLLGMLDKETLIRLHRTHTAHHLSFLVPKPTASV